MLMLYLSMLETDDEKQNFEQLYKRYLQDMYAVAYNILKNKEDAEDAVYQSFLKIAENFIFSDLALSHLQYYLGDINGDGRVNSADVTAINKYISK